MSFRELLLKLSYKKDIRVKTLVIDGICHLEISDWYTRHILLKKDIDIKKESKISKKDYKDFV